MGRKKRYNPHNRNNHKRHRKIHQAFIHGRLRNHRPQACSRFLWRKLPHRGGCPWTKDGTKADLALNVIARFLALNELKVSTHPYKHICETKISCCIGKSDIIYSYAIKDKYGQILEKNTERAYASPREVIEQFELRNPKFASICKNGLFGVTDTKHIWEL